MTIGPPSIPWVFLFLSFFLSFTLLSKHASSLTDIPCRIRNIRISTSWTHLKVYLKHLPSKRERIILFPQETSLMMHRWWYGRSNDHRLIHTQFRLPPLGLSSFFSTIKSPFPSSFSSRTTLAKSNPESSDDVPTPFSPNHSDQPATHVYSIAFHSLDSFFLTRVSSPHCHDLVNLQLYTLWCLTPLFFSRLNHLHLFPSLPLSLSPLTSFFLSFSLGQIILQLASLTPSDEISFTQWVQEYEKGRERKKALTQNNSMASVSSDDHRIDDGSYIAFGGSALVLWLSSNGNGFCYTSLVTSLHFFYGPTFTTSHSRTNLFFLSEALNILSIPSE